MGGFCFIRLSYNIFMTQLAFIRAIFVFQVIMRRKNSYYFITLCVMVDFENLHKRFHNKRACEVISSVPDIA